MNNRKARFLQLIAVVFILHLASLVSAGSVTALTNQLKSHPSPYLAMHGDDPVQWQEWGKAAVDQAQKENKLLFISSGYFSCHWCHVMQKESYKNQDIAKILNSRFIPVKVDRELHPALDSHLIDFVEKTQGSAGWPLNVFVTADGYPLVGLTYAPPENFRTILQTLDKEWTSRNADLKALAKSATSEIATAQIADNANLPKDLSLALQQTFVNQTFAYADELQGGFGDQNKFPSVPQLDFLLDIYVHKPDSQIKQFLTTTLNQMASQGLWDQLGGGFYRYVVDPGWQVPHFEKMLYDNALLAMLYFRAGEIFNNPAYTMIAEQTLEFILHDMNTAGNAFAASLSAVDDKGIEGGYYLWDHEELKKSLTELEYKVVTRFWGIDQSPDLEDGHHLVQSTGIPLLVKEYKRSEKDVSDIIQSASKKMLVQRARRVLPKDEKILTSWNGLTLSALVSGAKHNSTYKQAAAELVVYIQQELWQAKHKQLHKAIGKTGSLGQGILEDYAYIARGLFDWWSMTKDAQTKKLLEELLTQAWQRFYTKQGWILAEDMLLKYGSGMTMVRDDVLPSPSSVLIMTTYDYAIQTSNNALKEKALRALNVGHEQLTSNAFWHASQIKAISQVQSAR